ncbi:hypothetical protein Tco_0953309 [Tanacetum coccineum]|uniref:Uncharacterized protein n=1 Tax=Tanacetum coccineum TaxID=301880 RepID=A0ABQ5E3Z4_9ASTR
MHVEKNVAESLVGTLLHVPGKTKDGVNARLDLTELGGQTRVVCYARRRQNNTTSSRFVLVFVEAAKHQILGGDQLLVILRGFGTKSLEFGISFLSMTISGTTSYAFSDSLLLTPLCCDDIHDVTPRVSALAGCDRLVSEPLVIEK